ncbi:kinesin-like protein KIF20B [Biomphalaria glabrata]|uniref:Kinesin-like protein KIF20B n=1 Tax=Biomphalaria glabrata TaxID=6526 RepID=A0A9W3AJC8_BIOGL|nr:kinesin-like protein KIF20B [Biomphalaria glabrata]XP_055887234.1 kinesin-like protein KIF20B [Biomphalaria glabrata]XP_055887236.1 kinesin-like protein KIF20B [Biomphalaria glabrata]
MENQGTISKRNYSALNSAGSEETDYEEPLVKKKLRTKLVDLFDRASICLIKSPEDRMKIYLRIKPFTANEDSSQKCFVVAPDENTVIATAPFNSHAHKSMKRGVGKSSHKFTFSKIFNEDTSQAQFFNETMLEMTKDFIAGQNSLVFTYGVTSSGKTYTIQGKPQDAGVLPRCLDVIFNSINGKQIPSMTLKPKMFTDVVRLSPEEIVLEKRIKEKTLRLSVSEDTAVKTLLGDEMESALSDTALSTISDSISECGEEILKDVENRARELIKVDVDDQGKILFGVWVSFAEIYNEKIFDLLEPIPTKKNARRQGLKICDDKNGNPYIRGLKEINVESADEAYRLLTIGQRNLQTACTRLNHCSSRSHCIFNIKIVRITDKDEPHIARVSMLSLCDLAGSERYSKTQATGDRLKEAGNINSSLMTLSRCIETLRHNQMHRDKPRLVPFRESKLTRLLQNFFNGSGRASMIVNVSQCPQMFDDTLHVFQFSAIAKQVKYVEQPPTEPTKVLKEKKLPNVERGSIAWESPEKGLREACIDLTLENEDNEDEEEEDSEESQEGLNKIKEMKAYIMALETRNEKLVELLEEEMNASSEMENRIRKEVTQALMKQVVSIEETYSTMLKETRDEGIELADERVKAIMEIYEEKLERIQKKVDEDDEWVSSLLYLQEQVKVQDRDAQIKELQSQITKLQSKDLERDALIKELQSEINRLKSNSRDSIVDDSIDLGNTVLIETLSSKLKDSLDNCKMKDEKINELEALLSEAGDDYNKHVAEIAELKDIIDQQKVSLEQKISTVEEMKKKLSVKDQHCTELTKTVELKEKEFQSLEEELMKKIKCKDTTITSLEEEIKEMQDEIERLQDQMSLIDEQSKYKNDLDSSVLSNKSKRSELQPAKVTETDLSSNSITLDKLCKESSPSNAHEEKIESLLQTCKANDEEITNIKQLHTEQLERNKALKAENEQLITEMKNIQDQIQCTTEELKISQIENKQLKETVEAFNTKDKLVTENLEILKKENFSLVEELKSLKTANEDFKKLKECKNTDSQELQPQSIKNIEETQLEASITDMVKHLEGKHTPLIEKTTPISDKSKNQIDLTKDDNSELLTKLKNAELANTALRSKLKKEEEDFFQREQALIHGYTAEIDTLKFEIAKLKTKTEVPKARLLRGKRKLAGMDVSVSSVTSDSLCESSESGIDINKDEENVSIQKQTNAVLSHELVEMHLQLTSLHAAYTKLQKEKANGTTNMFIQDVALGTPKNRPSTLGIFRSEENVADSLLQFEMEEYIIKMEDLRIKISQQELELKECKKALENEKMMAKKKQIESESHQKYLEELNTKHECEKAFLNTEIIECKEFIVKNKTEIENLNLQLKNCQDLINEKEGVEKLLEEEKKLSCKLKNQLNELTAYKDLENEQKLLILKLQEDLNQSLAVNVEKETKLKLLFEEENSARALLDKLQEENTHLKQEAEQLQNEKQELKCTIEQLNTKVQELVGVQELLSETTEKFKMMNTSKDCLEKEFNELKSALASKEETVKRLENHSNSLLSQQQLCLNEKNSQSQFINNLQSQLEVIKAELLAKTSDLESLKSKYQEEAAEVAQKLLAMERDKKLAERKAADAKEKEEEWKIKCQGSERKEQLEQSLHEQLKATANTLKRQREEIVALTEDLTSKKEELKRLQQENASIKANVCSTDELNLKMKDLEQKFEMEKERLTKEHVEQMNSLKQGLAEAEEIMTDNEQIISEQDESILKLKAEIEMEKEKLDKLTLSKDLEITYLNKQLLKLEEALKQSEQESKERLCQEQMQQKTSREKEVLKEKFHNLEKEKLAQEFKIESLEKSLKSEQERVEEADRKLSFTDKQKTDLQLKLSDANKEHDLLKERLESLVKEKNASIEKIAHLELEVMQWKNMANKDISQSNSVIGDLEEVNKLLNKEIEKLKQELESKVEIQKEDNKVIQDQNKELKKLQRLNERNREEMELWKKEKDNCVSQLEHLINKRQSENKLLSQENEQLKADNAQLVKNVESITNMKDSLIADLRKSNNILSIELAKLQGMSPPPTMLSPCNLLTKREFIEDTDTTGHIEIDATPPIAAKKIKKHGSLKLLQSNILSSSIDPDKSSTPLQKSLKTIEELTENEMSPYTPKRTVSPSKHSLHSATGKVVELATDFISTLTPSSRSARKKSKESKKNKKKMAESTSFETELTPNIKEESENVHPFGTRRSSRLKCKTKP